ncbi:MAG TPA: mycofactocin-associated electron transfer flavoprotein alpha subunit, partial [Acidimicrobiales bacterium]|nr:mycofactocin-associated electron transfer flavoprotein alpha subunit [Acidimicrobiales bacterium]
LAPRLAAELERPLLAGATEVRADRVVVVRQGGRVSEEYEPVGPFVTTLEPGSRGIEITSENGTASDADTGAGDNRNSGNGRNSGGGRNSDDAWDLHGTRVERIEPHVAQGLDAAHGDARVVEVLPPDPAAIDLAEAPRIMAGGAGLGDAYAFEVLRSVAAALGASMGATRVVTDAGFVAHERQIGTTGVSVSPRLYIALGISGAVQHTGGLGRPEHIVSVNLDPSCPMMTMADVAIVSDARGVLDALAERLGVREERFGTAEERLGVQEESLPKHDEGVHRGA